jgi:hypothetical protein
MKNISSLMAVLLLAGSLTGCETTGDPNSGGIFWSPTKAQQRLDQRQQTLNGINSDTRRVERQNRRMENQLDQDQ